MDVIQYCLGLRFGALGPYLVLELYYYATETLRLDTAVSYELGRFNCCHGMRRYVRESRRISRNLDSNEWYVVCLAGARQKALLCWKEPCRGNSGRRADEVSESDLMGNGYPAVEKEHEFCLGWQKIVN